MHLTFEDQNLKKKGSHFKFFLNTYFIGIQLIISEISTGYYKNTKNTFLNERNHFYIETASL